MSNCDPTEGLRRVMVDAINESPVEALPEPHWDTAKLQAEFEVLGFMAPFVKVRRKSDGVEGAMMFKHSPRVYFDFKPL